MQSQPQIVLETSSSKTMTRHEHMCGYKPSISYLKTFGCLAYHWIPGQEQKGKPAYKSAGGIFIGYPDNKKGHVIEDPNTTNIVEGRDVIFSKHQFPYKNIDIK